MTIKEQVYIGGPMRGYRQFNFPAFDSMAYWLRHNRRKWQVHSPAEHDREQWPDIESWAGFEDGDTERCPKFDLSAALTWDLARVAESQHLVLLPGWEQSTGVAHERYVAELTGSSIWLAFPTVIPGEWNLVLDISRQDLKPRRIEGEDIERLEGMQRLAPSTVVGLVGYAQVGKDTLAAQLVEKHGFQRIAFADVLRECLYALNPIIATGSLTIGYGPTTYHTRRLQDLVDKQGWDQVKVKYTEVRELLQRLGTEVGRNILGTDIWVETALNKVKPGGKYVITDVRFPNEFAAIEKLGGTTVRIMRQGHGPVNGHWSETALDSYTTDISVWNSTTPEDLLDIVAKDLGLIPRTWTKAGVPAPLSSTIGGQA